MAKELTYRIDAAEFDRLTRRLGPAVVGAYIRILLDYFTQGEAPPNDDNVLARIAGVDMAFWKDLRPKLEPLFVLGEVWLHDYTEGEVAAREKRSERGKAAQRRAVDIPNTPQTARAMPPAPTPVEQRAHAELAESVPQGDPEVYNDTYDEDDVIVEPPVPQPPGIVFEGPIDQNFHPAAHEIADYMADGYTGQQIADVLDEFRRYNLHAGTISNNWPELWTRWWNRKKPPLHPAEKAKAKPRVEVSRRPPAPPAMTIGKL